MKCLESVANNISSLERSKVQVIVVDNASSDGSVELLREQFPWVVLIENQENIGFARANNQAILLSTGNYMVLLNSDTELQAGALSSLLECISGHPDVGAVGPRMLNPDGTLQNSYGDLPSIWDEILGPYRFDIFTKPWGRVGSMMKPDLGHSLPRDVDRVSFACTMIRRSALEAVGLLDERFQFYSEDYDFFKRLKDSGWRVRFCPTAQVMHHWAGSSKMRSEWALRQLYRSKRLYVAKHFGRRHEAILRIGVFLRLTTKMILAYLSRPILGGEACREYQRYRSVLRDLRQAVTPIDEQIHQQGASE